MQLTLTVAERGSGGACDVLLDLDDDTTIDELAPLLVQALRDESLDDAGTGQVVSSRAPRWCRHDPVPLRQASRGASART